MAQELPLSEYPKKSPGLGATLLGLLIFAIVAILITLGAAVIWSKLGVI